MDIGTAIKTLRKKKGYSQKDLAHRSELSVNALCQIERNASFPQKGTIKKICEVLDVPTSYLLFFAISEEDVPEHKREFFKDISPTVERILLGD